MCGVYGVRNIKMFQFDWISVFTVAPEQFQAEESFVLLCGSQTITKYSTICVCVCWWPNVFGAASIQCVNANDETSQYIAICNLVANSHSHNFDFASFTPATD